MQKEILITLGLIAGFFLIRLLMKKRSQTDAYSDVLINKKYEVKGQWDR